MGNDISVTIITDPSMQQHDTGGGEHPEVPARLQTVYDALKTSMFGKLLVDCRPKPATRKQLLFFHTEDWLFRFEEAVLSGRTYIDHPDNQVGYESYNIAMLSAGTGITGVEEVEANRDTVVFGVTRPPGHHAEPNMPFGFCFFNNCVIAARYWQQKYDRRRVCVIDFDAHHGNGIQTAFEEDSEAAYISIHEHPGFSYPGTGWPEENGLKEGRGTVLNLTLLPGAGDEQVIELFPSIISFLEKFQPEAIVVAAGFDSHVEDDMSGLNFTTEIYQTLGCFIAGLADRFAGGRLLSILEGGYHLDSLGECAVAYLNGILSHRLDDCSSGS